ncbi:MAG: hypothetical protein RLY94_715 [Chloroflexota bacterium]
MSPNAESAPRVRLARITDLSALVEISRRAQRALQEGSGEMRSLGLPLGPAALSLYQLFRMPLSLIRSSDSIWIHQRGAFADGLARVERDDRGDWTIVELDAVDDAARARLLARVAREAGRHGVVRLHVACAEDAETLLLLSSAGFQPYARETLYLRKGGSLSAPGPASSASAAQALLRPGQPSDALRIAQLMSATTPPAVSRMELIDAREWERAAAGTWAPRASITPLLRLAEQSTFVVDGAADEISAWLHLGVAREIGEAHPHALRISLLPGVDAAPLIEAGLAEIAERATRAGTAENGVLAVVRSYEGGLGTALTAQGFTPIGDLRLAVRDARARVTAPGMLPAIG